MDLETLSPPKAVQTVHERVRHSKFGQLSPFARKLIVAVIGGTILLIGVLLIVLPGPALIVIPLGLGVLASEFVWARRVVKRGKLLLRRVKDKIAR